MNQKEAFEIAKAFLDSEAEAFDNATIELGKNQNYGVTVAFNYLTAIDVAVLNRLIQTYKGYGFQVSEREISVFTPEGE